MPNSISADFTALKAKMKIIDDLLGGTQKMRQAGQTYLYKMKMEEEESYKNRLGRSTLYPALRETLSQMLGRVFFNPINVENVHKQIEPLFDDIDLEGNNLDVFASRWFYASLAYGVSYCLVDFMRIENARSLAEEKAQNARPYLVHIKPQQVLGFKTAKIRGKTAFTQFRYKESVTEDDGEFGTKQVDYIYVYEIGRVRKYKETESGAELVADMQITAQNVPLAFVPIVPFITKPTDVWGMGEPPLMELAYLNIKHWQSQSDQDNILNIARVPLLAIFSDTEIRSLEIGASAISLPKESTMQFIEHSGSSIDAGLTSLKELEDQMKTAGAKLLTKTALAMTDSQAKDEAGKEISQLRYYANKFEDALDLAFEYIGHWLGIGVDEVGTSQISGNIDNDLDPNASMATIIQLRNAGVISNHSTFEEAKRRGLLSDSAKWEDEQARLQAEGLSDDFTNPFNSNQNEDTAR